MPDPADEPRVARGSEDGSKARLYASLIEGAGDLVVAFDDGGTIVFVNEASRPMLAMAPDEIVGQNVFEFIHPDDLERAARALAFNVEFGSAPGTTAFRLRHADGSWIFVDMTGGHASDDGARVLFSSFSRTADDRFAMSETLVRLLHGSSLADALRPVCDTFAWRANGSHVGICWRDGLGERGAISTGVDLDLVGGGPDHEPSGTGTGTGAGPETPWGEVRRTGDPVTDLDLSRLDPPRRAAAAAAGLGAYWIEPIRSGVAEPALITVWTRAGSRPPANHALAMETAHPVVELILRWAEQQRQLDHAAFHDALTGLSNRKRFFDALESCTTGGAVLYCDLDRFKPVNDQLGHAAGDRLLQLVAARLRGCVRDGDLVARVGGDEFVLLCPTISEADAHALAGRVEAVVGEPFVVDGESVSIGISVGVAHDTATLGPDLLNEADLRLYHQKARGRR
jgi:diguanylate cyclase (GGDEF)-like protein/PAS domain S-box-containing protein